MTHNEFVEAYRAGSIRVHIDHATAARYMSDRLLLPLVILPVLGIGVGLALVGWIWTGLALIGAATIAPMLIKRTAPHFIITQALQDQQFYEEVTSTGLVKIVPTGDFMS